MQLSTSMINANSYTSKPEYKYQKHFIPPQFSALDEKDKSSLEKLLSQLIALFGGTKQVRKEIPDWDNLRTTTKLWRLFEKRGNGKPTKGWKKPD